MKELFHKEMCQAQGKKLTGVIRHDLTIGYETVKGQVTYEEALLIAPSILNHIPCKNAFRRHKARTSGGDVLSIEVDIDYYMQWLDAAMTDTETLNQPRYL